MSRSIRVLASVGLTLAALALGEPRASAGDSAQGFVQTRHTQVAALLRQTPSVQRDKQIATVLDGMMDYDDLARRSLANHWGDINDTQRKDFAEILKRLVQRNYEKSLKSILQYKLEYLGEDPESEGVTVHTRASSTTDQRDEPVAIDYRLTEANGTWKVLDIVTEGSSLVNNYKNQFHHIIQKDGFDTLVKRMKEKLAKGQA
jgi:phospholipid transport system substrate-binding protein